MTSEMGHIRGLEEITGAFDKSEIGLILATGVRKYHEYQSLKGKREEKEKNPHGMCTRLQISMPWGISMKVPFTLSKPKEEEEETPSTTTTVPEAAATSTSAMSTAAETDVPTTTT